MLKFIATLLFAQVLLAAPLPQNGGTIDFPSIDSPLTDEKPLTQDDKKLLNNLPISGGPKQNTLDDDGQITYKLPGLVPTDWRPL